ncbi:MAG: large subunit ribosomal protein L35 [Alphaproteobacteria bacterium]|jgi:large subunit ribosomal protein L35
MAGYKLKTKKAAAKRFTKSTATGKIKRGIQGHGHFLSKLGQKAYALAGSTFVSDADFARVDKMLPYFNAKRKRTRALKKVQARNAAAKAELAAATATAVKSTKAKTATASKGTK